MKLTISMQSHLGGAVGAFELAQRVGALTPSKAVCEYVSRLAKVAGGIAPGW
jgi:hypothetical protein